MKTFDYQNDVVIDGNNFYPVHLSLDELAIILDEFISNIGDITYLKGFVRKTMSKGIEYKVLLSNKAIKDVHTIPSSKEYSIVILPNWSIEILDHWLSLNMIPRCEKIDATNLNAFVVNEILRKRDVTQALRIESTFKKDDWRLLRKMQDVVLI